MALNTAGKVFSLASAAVIGFGGGFFLDRQVNSPGNRNADVITAYSVLAPVHDLSVTDRDIISITNEMCEGLDQDQNVKSLILKVASNHSNLNPETVGNIAVLGVTVKCTQNLNKIKDAMNAEQSPSDYGTDL